MESKKFLADTPHGPILPTGCSTTRLVHYLYLLAVVLVLSVAVALSLS